MSLSCCRRTLARLALAAAVASGAACMRGHEPPISEEAVGTVGMTTSDERIRQELDRLFLEQDVPDLDESDLRFAVKNGVVTVDGEVRTAAARQKVEQRVRGVAGVTSVVNNLEVEEAARGTIGEP